MDLRVAEHRAKISAYRKRLAC